MALMLGTAPDIWRYINAFIIYYYVWNGVPAEIKAAANIGVCKRLIKLWNGPSCQCNMCTVLC